MIPTSLMAPPKKDIISLGKAQLGFMNLFALPLFQGVADLMPAMQYCVDELEANKVLFEMKIQEEDEKVDPAVRSLEEGDGSFSPKTLSMAVAPNPGDEEKASPPIPTQTLLAASAPTILATRTVSEKEFMTQPADPVEKPASLPALNSEYNEVNGGPLTTFEAVADFAASDPFNVDDGSDGRRRASRKQRGSENAEGGPLAYPAEWPLGPTNATTAKMPLSPSTQGTSFISRDSMDRPVSVPVTITTAPESTKSRTDLKTSSCASIDDSHSSNNDRDSPTLSPQGTGQSLKKKPSRFRINARHFFRRNKGCATPASATTDAAG